MVHLRLLTDSGGQHAPENLPGLPSFTSALMDEGTTKRTGPDLAAEIERLGGYLGTGAGWDAAVIEAEVLAKDFATGLELVAEVAREASFPEPEVNRVRRQLLAEIVRRRADPSSVASEHFEGSLYGSAVYGRPLIGTEESLEAMNRASAVEFFSHHVGPAGATLVAVGDIQSDRLATAAEAVFSGWTGVATDETPRGAPLDLAPQKRLRVEIVDRPGAAQTAIRVGHRGIERGHPRWVQASVLNCLLGGKFTSRLNLNLRETHGFTYGVRSGFGKRLGRAPFVISTALANEHVGAALDEIFRELERLREEVANDAEVADTRDYMIGSFPYSVETLRGLAGRLSDLAIYGLPDDYFARYPEVLAAVSGADLLETARELLAPDRALVVCVGPDRELRPQLEDRYGANVSVVAPGA